MPSSRRIFLAGGMMSPAALAAANASALDGARGGGAEVRRFEDFGARGDAVVATGRGSDDTQPIQAAIDWAFAGGTQRQPRAIAMDAKAYLCGPVTLHPTTTIIGTGRQTSAFLCRPGTRGEWFSTRGGGGQKLMLSGFALYARHERGLTHIARLGAAADEVPVGTESILQGLWFRDAPEAIGLEVVGNVSAIADLTLQSVRIGLSARGAANHAQNLFVMQAGEGSARPETAAGVQIDGWFVRGLHVEATVARGVPVRMRGNCHVSDAFISSVTGYELSHLVEIDDSEYDQWSLGPLELSENRYRISGGVVRTARGFADGRDVGAWRGRETARAIDARDHLRLGGHAYRSQRLTIRKQAGALQYRLAPSWWDERASPTGSAAPAKLPTYAPLTAAGAGRRTASAVAWEDGAAAILLGAMNDPAQCHCQANVAYARLGRQLLASPCVVQGRLAIRLTDAIAGDPIDLATIAERAQLEIILSGFLPA